VSSNLLNRGLVILAVVAIAGFSAYPPEESINLGLDLRGGMHLVLQVETSEALRAEAEQDMDRFVSLLESEAGVPGARAAIAAADGSAAAPTTDAAGAGGEAAEGTEKAGQDRAAGASAAFRISGVAASDAGKVRQIYNDFFSNRWDFDRSGDAFVLRMKPPEARAAADQTVEQAMRNIRNRIDEYGVAEPVIQRQGFGGDADRIVVQLPGVDDPERVKALIKKTALLEFRLSEKPRTGQEAPYPTRESLLAEYGGTVPPGIEILPGDVTDPVTGEVVGENYYALEARAVVTGRDLKGARTSQNQFNEPIVSFTLTQEKGRDFAQVTGSNVGRRLAIVIDEHVISAPNINSQIAADGMIEGQFTFEEATDLATALKSGALPATITTLEERTVGPSLGQDSIDQGLRAGLLGGGLVVLIMLVVYLLSGINAVVVLTLNVVLVFGALAGFGATLTLPGIAGIILTIGMAVDANVLIFERIREELRAGRTVKSAVSAGFQKALSSILDANVTTLIAALFLFNFGTGPIRGFAVTLSVGILASVFTAVFVSRFLFDLWLSRRQRLERLSI
jgi:preprotein translocase subunit SecD